MYGGIFSYLRGDSLSLLIALAEMRCLHSIGADALVSDFDFCDITLTAIYIV